MFLFLKYVYPTLYNKHYKQDHTATTNSTNDRNSESLNNDSGISYDQ